MAELDTRPWIAFAIVGLLVAGLMGFSLGRPDSTRHEQVTGGEHGLSLLQAVAQTREETADFLSRHFPATAKKVNFMIDRYFYEHVLADICIEFAGPTERDTEFGTTCDAILKPGPYKPAE